MAVPGARSAVRLNCDAGPWSRLPFTPQQRQQPMGFPQLSDAFRCERLVPPGGPVRMVLDTDTYNEVDDQFAVAYALLAPEVLTLEAIYAAPFHNDRSSGPGDGMERSYQEIHTVIERMNSPFDVVLRGSQNYLAAAGEPVDSPAARDLIARALASDQPLYVATIGAPTNVASALLLEPSIVERIVVVWLAGHPHDWPTAREFNLVQDLHASRVLFDSGVPLVQIPARLVAEQLRTTVPELDACLRGRGALADYLCDIVAGYATQPFCYSKVIWDIAAIAWLVQPDWVPTVLTSTPILTSEVTYSRDASRPLMRLARICQRDAIFGDLFRRFS